MRLTDTQLGAYISNKLALPGPERNEYRKQVKRLTEKLTSVLADDGSYNIIKFRRAGSLEKGTSNRPRADKPVDADVGAYFKVDDPNQFDVAELQRLIKKLLLAAYPQKSDEDFDDSRDRTFGVVFKGSGLEVDLVPIVSIDDEADYGFQYSRSGDRVRTSVKAHLEHFRDHASRDPILASIVRLAKQWKAWQELGGISSFHLELILSYLVDTEGPAQGLEEGIRRLFLFVMRDLQHGVQFGGASTTDFSDPVVIIDPANSENNVAARITADECSALIAAATTALETITWAQELPGKGETISAWKEVFGNSFAID